MRTGSWKIGWERKSGNYQRREVAGTWHVGPTEYSRIFLFLDFWKKVLGRQVGPWSMDHIHETAWVHSGLGAYGLSGWHVGPTWQRYGSRWTKSTRFWIYSLARGDTQASTQRLRWGGNEVALTRLLTRMTWQWQGRRTRTKGLRRRWGTAKEWDCENDMRRRCWCGCGDDW